MNFDEVRKAQLAKSTLLTSTSVPLGSFQIFLRSIQILKREWGAEVTAPIQSLVKQQPWFLSLRWKTCLRQNCSLGSYTCSERSVLGQNTLTTTTMMMMIVPNNQDRLKRLLPGGSAGSCVVCQSLYLNLNLSFLNRISLTNCSHETG